MKKGIFTSLTATFTATFVLLSFQGCAGFLELGAVADDPAEYDRGYAQAESESDEDEATCQGDSCNTETRGRSLASSEDLTSEESAEQRRVKRAIQTRDVVLGMSRGEVAESWGQPVQREVAGRGRGGHERWTYGSQYSLNGSRTVIFENGRVAGWNR